MAPAQAEYAWLDGEFVPWAEAKIHVRTECVMHGINVFEGVRGYWNEERQELYVFRLDEHLDRLYRSMKIMRMEIPHSRSQLAAACLDLLARNRFRGDVHFRPTVYLGQREGYRMGHDKAPAGAFISGLPRPTRLTSPGGIHCGISSWTRIADSSMPPRIKSAANYQNSILAATEAALSGYDNAILLCNDGKVSEGPGACVMLVRDGGLITPSVTSDILESITRATLLQLFRDELGLTVVEREVDRTELYIAEEVFFCGTGAEITPILSVDRYPIGNGEIGPLTQRMREIYYAIVTGRNPRYAHWLSPVYKRERVPA